MEHNSQIVIRVVSKKQETQLPVFSCNGYNPQDLGFIPSFIQKEYFFLWVSVKEELFHSTSVSLAPKLLRRRNVVSFQSLSHA